MSSDNIINIFDKTNDIYKLIPKSKSRENTTLDYELPTNHLAEEVEADEKLESKISDYYSQLRDGLKHAQESADAVGKAHETLAKCLQIALRIVSGDTVPIQDQKYLMENNMELYSMAMNMRLSKKDPKEWDTLLEEDKEPLKLQDNAKDIEVDTEPLTVIKNEGL